MSVRFTIVGAVAVTVAGLAGCSSSRQSGEPSPGAGDLERTGRLVVSGPDGLRMVSLVTDGGQSVGLVGELLDELTRLSGAVVTVVGPRAQTLQSEGVEVTRYDVNSIDGETPVVGVLRSENGLLRLEDGQSVPLVDPPAGLADEVGAKIWVTGPDTPNGRRVRSYGVIRPRG